MWHGHPRVRGIGKYRIPGRSKVNDIKVSTDGHKLVVASPYCTALFDGARELAGQFGNVNGHGQAWVFFARDEKRVRDLLVRVYGTDGGPAHKTAIGRFVGDRGVSVVVGQEVDRGALQAERDQLLARIAEIDALLAQVSS
jgi:hypothetical protein